VLVRVENQPGRAGAYKAANQAAGFAPTLTNAVFRNIEFYGSTLPDYNRVLTGNGAIFGSYRALVKDIRFEDCTFNMAGTPIAGGAMFQFLLASGATATFHNTTLTALTANGASATGVVVAQSGDGVTWNGASGTLILDNTRWYSTSLTGNLDASTILLSNTHLIATDTLFDTTTASRSASMKEVGCLCFGA